MSTNSRSNFQNGYCRECFSRSIVSICIAPPAILVPAERLARAGVGLMIDDNFLKYSKIDYAININ
jgi:hypothetical protein